MASSAKILRHQVDFTTWATNLVMAAAQELTTEELSQDFMTSDRSVLGTLVHCYRAERIWLNRILETKVDFKVEGDDTLDALVRNWAAIRSGWSDWARSLTEETAGADLTYTDLKGNTWTQPIWVVVGHVSNHSTHHRGQAIGFIRALGHVPPNVDLARFARENP